MIVVGETCILTKHRHYYLLSSKTENTLLIPGSEGWEIWQGTSEQGFRRNLENGPLVAAELDKLPKGKLFMGFPVREALAVPFKVQTEDEGMFEDLAAMHLEKIGIRPELDAGRLTDVFPAGHEDGQTTLLNVVLAAPEDGTMPSTAPQQFDLSPRFFPLPGNAVTLWRELGRWVFAISSKGHLTYFQTLPGAELTVEAMRDIRLALSQLSLQGVSLEMDQVVVWTSGHSSDPSDDLIHSFGKLLDVEIVADPKPRPILPETMSRLVPADVRAEQRMKAERQKRNMLIAAVLLVYLGLIGYFAYDYMGLSNEVKEQEKELAKVNLDHADIGLFNQDWDELFALVEDDYWPLNTLYRSTGLIPKSQVSQIRCKVFEANNERVYIDGEAADIKQASALGQKLEKSFPDHEWKEPVIGPDNKTNRWTFRFEGNLIGSETEL